MREQITLNIPVNVNVKIQLQEDSLPAQCNVSNISNVSSASDTFGYAGFHVSESTSRVITPLSGQYKLYDSSVGYPGFISQKISASNNVVSPTMELSFNMTGGLADYITILFDEALHEYATDFKVILNVGSDQHVFDITDNNSVFVLVPLHSLHLSTATAATVILQITKWSKPNKNIKIVQFTPELTLRFSGKDIYNFTCSENSMDSKLSLTPGIVEQYADIELYDRQGTLRQIIGEGKLDDVAQCKINIYAVDQETSYFLGSYRVKNWEAQTSAARVSITCDDVFASFENIEVPAISIQTRTLDEWINIMFNYANITSWRYANTSTEQMCKNITLYNSWAKPGNLYEFINKICAIGLLRMYYFEGQFIIMQLVKIS